MQHAGANIIQMLLTHAQSRPEQTAFIWLPANETHAEAWSYGQLLTKVQKLAAELSALHLQGKRALLVYNDAKDFIVAFLACQYIGLVAVPVLFPANKRFRAKLLNIMEDAQIGAVLTLAAHQQAMDKELGAYWQQNNIALVNTDEGLAALDTPITAHPSEETDIAFIQYTSGSTGQPKGVLITHHNLLHNQQLIQQTFGCNHESVIMTWLPFHHDMGLIGNILHSLYVGCTCVVMPPMQFLIQPLKWLQSIGQYKVTHSGGPNFAYDHCLDKIKSADLIGLDLSSWKVAFNGAEPVRPGSLQAFADFFQPAGFNGAAFYPCYGLAEATLLVSGCKPQGQVPAIIYVHKVAGTTDRYELQAPDAPTAKALVSAGRPPQGMVVKVLQANAQACDELEAGEICIGGDSVTQGYWNKDNTPFFYQLEDGPYLRTGDSGFMYRGELFVSGRIKEMMIIRGENFYPYDLEFQVASTVEAIQANGVAAFGVELPAEALVVVAELGRSHLRTADGAAIVHDVAATLASVFGLVAHDIVLTTPRGIPRTSSGKIQRLQCAALYLQQNGFTVIASLKGLANEGGHKTPDMPSLLMHVKHSGGSSEIKAYLMGLIGTQTGHWLQDENKDLTSLGIDSLRAMQLINNINNDLNINMDVTAIFEHHTTAALAEAIGHLLWLKSGVTTREGEMEI